MLKKKKKKVGIKRVKAWVKSEGTFPYISSLIIGTTGYSIQFVKRVIPPTLRKPFLDGVCAT